MEPSIIILTPEEADKVETIPPGRTSPLRIKLHNLAVGWALVVPLAAWKSKSNSPGVLCRRMERKTTLKFVVTKTADKLNWFIRRLK